MDFCELIKSRRSVRRFKPKTIDRNTLLDLLEAARSAPSAANRQPLEYVVVDQGDVREKIFEQLAWAGHVQPRRNPPKGKEPVAYIVVLINKNSAIANFGLADAAAAIENIMLAAWSEGIGSCWLGAIGRDNIREVLKVPESLEVNSVVALGYPDESPIMEDAEGETDDATKYYLDEEDRLHVPKKKLEAVTYFNKYGGATKR